MKSTYVHMYVHLYTYICKHLIAVLAYPDHTRHFAIKSQLFLCFCCCVIIFIHVFDICFVCNPRRCVEEVQSSVHNVELTKSGAEEQRIRETKYTVKETEAEYAVNCPLSKWGAH